jgi:hypothetical protein
MMPTVPTPSLQTQLLTEERVAWIWNVSERTIRQWRVEGKLRCIKKGKNVVRYQPCDVAADILASYRLPSHAQPAVAAPEDALWQRIERLIETAVESRLAKRMEAA